QRCRSAPHLGVVASAAQVPLQHLRRVAERLSHLEDDLWTKTTLYVLNRRVIFHEPGSRRLHDAVGGRSRNTAPKKLSPIRKETRKGCGIVLTIRSGGSSSRGM